jgi:hypothetical protein
VASSQTVPYDERPNRQPDEGEQQLGSRPVAAIEDVKSHCPASRRGVT